MEFGNTCALVCRFILLILLVYSIILSYMVMSSCHFISAITPNEDTHGVGLQTFENEAGVCEPHNSFVVKNYNGMEMAAKIGGIVAPSCGLIVLLWLLFECCKVDGCFGGKCIPAILLLAAVICQGTTFLLYQSELFCSNKDITSCALGDAGFRSIQACVVYAFCCILYFCSPTPIPFSPPVIKAKARVEEASTSEKKSSKPPAETGMQTREMYEERRKGKKVNSRGTSGRRKDELMNDQEKGSRDSGRERGSREKDRTNRQEKGKSVKREKERPNDTITIYDPNKYKKKGNIQEKFDDYVDTDPDGMDWSAYSPEPREEYLKRKREKKKKEKKAERHKDVRRGSSRSRRNSRDEDSRSHDDSFSVISKDSRGNSFYSDRDGYDNSGRGDYSNYDQSPGSGRGSGRGDYSNYDKSPGSGRGSGRGDYSNYDQSPGSGRDSGRGDYSNYDQSPGRGRDRRDNRGQDDYSQDDYSYAQSYAQDRYGDPPDNGDSYRQSSRSSSGHRRSKSRDRRAYNDHYDDSYSYDDRSRGYQDDPSFV